MARHLPISVVIAFLVVLLVAPLPALATGSHVASAPRRSAGGLPWGAVSAPGAPPFGAPPPGPGPHYGPWVNETSASANAPSYRSSTSMAYDPLLGEIVLFGGYDALPSGPDGDTWAYSGTNWTNLTSNLTRSPVPMWGSELVYDPALAGLILFGGRDLFTIYNTTWLFNSTGWWNLTGTVAPSPRIGPAMDYDPSDGYLLEFGGYNPLSGFAVYNDTWKLTGTGWSMISPTAGRAPPSSYQWGDGTWDAWDHYFVTYGGASTCGTPYTWTYVAGAWTNRTLTSGTPPPYPQGSFAIAYDPDNASVITIGGQPGAPNCAGPSNYTWAYTGGRWSNLSAGLSVSPTARCCGQLTDDPPANGLILFGGNAYTSVPPRLNDTWLFEGFEGVRFTTSPRPADVGQVMTLNATEATLTGPFKWNWAYGDGNVALNAGPNVTHTYASMGNYTIWLNVTDGNGTFYSDSLIVRIYPALAIAPAVSPLQSDAPASITYNAVPSGGAPLVGVTWNFSDGFSTHAVSGSHTVHSPGNYTAAVVVRDAAGEARFANFSLQVHPKIGVVSHLTPVVGIVPFLVNGTAALSGGTGPFAPTWDFGVGPSGINDSLNASYQYTLAGNYAVRFLASDALGGIAQDDYTVLALLPIKTFANATPLDGVRPFGTTFAVNALGGGGTFNYTWEFGDGSGNGYGRIADHTYASIGTYPVLVIARDQYGFTANSSLTVQVVEPLNATLQYSGRLGVAPYTVHLTALPTGGLGNDSFVWTFGDGGVASSGNTQTHDYLEYGNYSIYALVTDGIGDHYSLSGSIEVVQPLEARLVVEPGSGALGTLETFTATASQGYGPYTFDWSGLPTGCLLGNVSEGTCNGTAAGSFNVTVEVSDRLGEHLIEISPLQLTPNSASGPAAGGTSTPFTSEVVLGIVGITLLIVALAAFLFWRRSRPPTSVEEDATDPYAIPTAGEDPSMQGTEPPGDA